MPNFKVRVLYDFQGEPNTAEISINAGEVLTVTRTDVGEGWWEGINSQSKSGLFPEAYVEKVSESGPPSIPPPMLPPQNTWGGDATAPPGSNHDDDWDDDWDDDTYTEVGNPTNKRESIYSNEPNQNQLSYTGTASYNQSDNVSISGSTMTVDNKGTITKKSLNIFSSYVKSGLESYILGTLKEASSTASKRIHIFRENDDILGRWEALSNPYTVQIASPKKSSKMGGLKSFIAYQLTPSFTNVEVSRRYKHFDWLHDRLSDKFNLLAIPPLPDKQVSGRYEEHFIEHRRAQLQEFINYMCRHPVLSSCDVWIHFLTCTDEKQWKQGKRNAERDQLTGANFCLCIEAPEKEILPSLVETKIDDNIIYIAKMDQCIKNLMQTAMDQQKKCVNMYKREFTRIGESFFALGSAFEHNQQGMFSKASLEFFLFPKNDPCTGCPKFVPHHWESRNAKSYKVGYYSKVANSSALQDAAKKVDVKNIGTTYITIGKLYEEQAKIDWQPLFDKLYIYKGITGSLPDILNVQKMAEQKKKECERNSQAHQVALGDIRRRTDILTYTVFAEMNHFQHERDNDLKQTLKVFLQEQLNFYKNVVSKLEDTLNQFE